MAKTTKIAPAKYADKSAGQPELLPIFDALKKMVAAYAKGNYTIKADKPGHYELYYGKPVEVNGREYPELSFASILVQKGYVGFYFFPVHVSEALKKELDPALLKLLKGKTCFHIKKNDPDILGQVKKALQTGHDHYRSMGWN